jgi:hypothetical protein
MRTLSKLMTRVGWLFQPIFFLLAVADAGASAGTAKALMPEAPERIARAAISTSTSVLPAPLMKALRR